MENSKNKQTLSLRTSKDGIKNSFDLVKNIDSIPKIRDYENKEAVNNQLGLIFAEAFTLVNVKEATPDIIKRDIIDFIHSNCSGLRLEEIKEAFKYDRSCENPEEHFQSPNRVYVNKIIHKWLERKKEIKSRIKIKEVAVTASYEEKLKIRENLLKMIFNQLKQTGYSRECWMIYNDVEFEQKHNLEYKQILLEKELEKNKQAQKLKNPFKKVIPEANAVHNTCKAIMVSNYLKNFTDDYKFFKSKIKTIKP